MKLSNYAKELIELLMVELEARGGVAKFGEVFDYDKDCYRDELLAGMSTADICTITGAELTNGACSQVFVLPEVVIKWSLPFNMHDSDSASDERAYYKACDRGYEMHVAQTERVGFLTLQERIVPAVGLEWTMAWEVFRAHQSFITEVANDLQIGDMHSGNWGFRPDDVEYTTPVIFDFSCDRTSW